MKQFLHQHLAHEPCGAGDEHVTAAIKVRYRTGRAGHFDVKIAVAVRAEQNKTTINKRCVIQTCV